MKNVIIGQSYLRAFACVGALVLLLVMPSIAQAILQLNVNPVDGSNSIRFGRVTSPTSIDREVRIRITSTDGRQYQLYQRLSEPLVNERGEMVQRDVIEASALSGSNGSGSLYLENDAIVGPGDDLIYTSDQSGESDSFVILYKVNPDLLDLSGDFTGKLLYTLRPINGGASQQIVLNIFLEASGELRIESKTSSSLGNIRLESVASRIVEGTIDISFEGNLGSDVKVYQELVQLPINEYGVQMSHQLVEFYVTGGDKGTVKAINPQPLSSKRELIYTSSAGGDFITVHYQFNQQKLYKQTVGDFTGQLQFIVETDRSQEVIDAEFQVVISPVFELEITYPSEGMHFSNILPNSAPQIRELQVAVKTNLGKPYTVNQQVESLMTNKKGDMLSKEFFTSRQEIIEGSGGKVGASEFTPVEPQETILYQSNKNGDPAAFRVLYRLRSYPTMKGGDYEAAIRYSLGEI